MEYNDLHTVPPPSPPTAATNSSEDASSAFNHHSLSHAYQAYLSHDREEQNHWQDVCRSYRQYATFAMAQFRCQTYRLASLPASQLRYLPETLQPNTPAFNQRATAYKEAAIRNQFCLDCILRHAGQPHSQEMRKTGENEEAKGGDMKHSTDAQMSKVSSVLKSLARDWSAECKEERDLSYRPILETVQRYLPLAPSPRFHNNDDGDDATTITGTPPIRICVPGAGVGRLACDLASLGYAVQGNEFSLYMLLASDFILNAGQATPSKPLHISPFLLESRNVHGAADPIRSVAIPDVDPYTLLTDPVTGQGPVDFSMAGGDFCSIYRSDRERASWDCVVACFFLDTAACVVEYIQVIQKMLRPGGYLIHFGPLLWHWSGPAMRPDDQTMEDYHARYSYLDKKYLQSVDLSWEDVRQIIVNLGFEVVEERLGQNALYTADPRSLMQMNYRCVHFVARRGQDAEMGMDVEDGSYC
jgi:carnosine N-methyltransferase